jgi:ubiquinol-cytochrome c reductase cytochrome b subunit
LAAFATSFLVLGYLGLQPATGGYVTAARIFTIVYLAFFILMPFYTRNERTKSVPTRVRT